MPGTTGPSTDAQIVMFGDGEEERVRLAVGFLADLLHDGNNQ
jgi:hypothetical protein